MFSVLNLFSIELAKDRISKLNIKEHNLSIGMLVYGASDVMVSKHCIIGKIKKATNKNCGACQNHNYKLVDEYNDVFLVKYSSIAFR